MVLALIKPILAKLKKDPAPSSPLPTVEVTAEAERIYYDQMRAEMRKKVWEKDGGVVRLISSYLCGPLADPCWLHSRGMSTRRRGSAQ